MFCYLRVDLAIFSPSSLIPISQEQNQELIDVRLLDMVKPRLVFLSRPLHIHFCTRSFTRWMVILNSLATWPWVQPLTSSSLILWLRSVFSKWLFFIIFSVNTKTPSAFYRWGFCYWLRGTDSNRQPSRYSWSITFVVGRSTSSPYPQGT